MKNIKHILLLVDNFNSLSQAVYVWLFERGFELSVVYAINQKQMIKEIQPLAPDIILAPFLTKFIPEEIYQKYPTFVFHPGPIGDRGANSLEWALLNHSKSWGAVWLKADKEFDGGDIFASRAFDIKSKKKSALYRQEMNFWAVDMLGELLENIVESNSTPQIKNPIHLPIPESQKVINWQSDTTQEIIKKINLLDSRPGVKDEILGVECSLFGAWVEERLGVNSLAKPKEIIAKRSGAICLKTVDGAVWVSHLMEPNRFKLPASYVLKNRLQGVKEERLPLIFDKSYQSFYEIAGEFEENVAYLYFNFHNGAMSATQCIELKYAIEYLKEDFEIIVLMGGEEFFSNGIHLNILEDSKKQGEDGWSNINAINNLIESILLAEDNIFITSFGRNAGAGGVFLGLSADLVIARDGVVLNPHYKSLGLDGSEFHTYTLPKRVGKEISKKLLDDLMPVGSGFAKEIGLVDEVLPAKNYQAQLRKFVQTLAEDDDKIFEMLEAKRDRLQEDYDTILDSKVKELEVIHPQFWERSSDFHKLRREFVYKLCPVETPPRLKRLWKSKR
jgi:putative two-component system hydrogenase maturation factor HypX/HoxX